MVLRPAFRYRRRLLPKLALCAWKALSSFLREDTGGNAPPAAIVSIQNAGEFLNWHPHLHVLAHAGAFRADGGIVHSPLFDPAVLRDLFQANVLALLLKDRVISPELVERMGNGDTRDFMRTPARRFPTSRMRCAWDSTWSGDPPRPDSPWLAARRKSWARLIRRVYEVDPFLCRCGERMRVVGFITQPPII